MTASKNVLGLIGLLGLVSLFVALLVVACAAPLTVAEPREDAGEPVTGPLVDAAPFEASTEPPLELGDPPEDGGTD